MEGKTYGITMKDKLGYALGDTAGMLLFGMIGPFLQMFYTDTLHIDPAKIMVLFIVARLWDAVNDPLWGTFIDNKKAGRHGKYKRFFLWLSLPLAILGTLMFVKIPGLSENQYLIYAYITYIGYGMLYTGTNIPLGSLNSTISSDPDERASLSAWRSIGSTLGGLPASLVLPFFVYTYAVGGNAKVLDPQKLMYAVMGLAALCFIIYLLSYKMITERVPEQENREKVRLLPALKAFCKNRPFVILCLASICLLASQMYTQTLYNYLFKSYFNAPSLYAVVMVCTYGPMILLMPFLGKLVARFGKKELSWFGAAIALLSNTVLWALKTTNPMVFLVFVFISGFGITFFAMEIWALVTDVIDYHELTTGKREEATGFSFFSFTRKLGQTIAGLFSTYVLVIINYDVDNITPAMNSRMYDLATLLPAAFYLIIILLLAFAYPLSKKGLIAMRAEQK